MGIFSIFKLHTKVMNVPPQVAFSKGEHGLLARIQTARLKLESVAPSDIKDYQALFGNAEVMRMYAAGQPVPSEKIAERINNIWLQRRKNDDPYHGLAIRDAKGRFIGHAIVGYGDKPGQSEAAVLLHKWAWNKGYATEIGAGLKEFALETIRQGYLLEGKTLEEITATARLDNKASIQAMQHAKMTETHRTEKWGALRAHYSIKVYSWKDGDTIQATFSRDAAESALAARVSERAPSPRDNAARHSVVSRAHGTFVRATDCIADTLHAACGRVYGVLRSAFVSA